MQNVLLNIKSIKSKYEEYSSEINYNDNRDFIPYVTIRHVLEKYILPSIELALVLEKKIEETEIVTAD